MPKYYSPQGEEREVTHLLVKLLRKLQNEPSELSLLGTAAIETMRQAMEDDLVTFVRTEHHFDGMTIKACIRLTPTGETIVHQNVEVPA